MSRIRVSGLFIVVLLVLGFLLGPLVVVALQAFSNGSPLDLFTSGPSTRWFSELSRSPEWIQPFQTSLLVGAITTLVSVSVGIAAALGMARHMSGARPIVRSIMRLAVLLPLIVPTVIIGMALLSAFKGTPMVFSLAGVVAGHVVLTLPYAVFVMEMHVSQSNPDMERAARTLGASGAQSFRRITLPLMMPAALTSALFVFYNSWEEVVVTSFVSGSRMQTMPVAIFQAVQNQVSPLIAALSTVLMVGTLLLVFLFVLVRKAVRKTITSSRENSPLERDERDRRTQEVYFQ